MLRVMTPDRYRTMPWKNGGGMTTEIATHPDGAGLAIFAWRISVADVDRDGAFSRFPGIDRTILLLDGAGMRLTGGARTVDLRPASEPYSFSGDDDVDCALVAGPVRDFNAMFRRGHARGSVSVARGEGASIPSSSFRVAFAASGRHECVVAGQQPVELEPGQSLIDESVAGIESAPLAIRPLTAGGVVVAVCIECP
jgi:uncharacterized protein